MIWFLGQLFEVGVDEMSWDDLSQAKEDWPSVREAWAYRGKAYKVRRDNLIQGWLQSFMSVVWGCAQRVGCVQRVAGAAVVAVCQQGERQRLW